MPETAEEYRAHHIPLPIDAISKGVWRLGDLLGFLGHHCAVCFCLGRLTRTSASVARGPFELCATHVMMVIDVERELAPQRYHMA